MKFFAPFLSFSAVAAVRKSLDSSKFTASITEDTEPYKANWYHKQIDAQFGSNFNANLELGQLFGKFKITPDQFEKQLNALVASAPTRYIGSGEHGIGKARDYIKSRFIEFGFDQDLIRTPQVPVQGINTHNILAELPGADPNCWAMIAAHYDSIPMSGPAPGAEDNGSGVTGVLLAAKQAKLEGTPRCTIVFATFTGEEEGLYGSKHFAKSMVQNDQKCAKGEGSRCHLSAKNCLGAIILDEIAYTHSKDSSRTAIFESAADSRTARNKSGNWGTEQGRMFDIFKLAEQSIEPDNESKALVNYHGFGSDHMSIMEACVPAVLLIDKDNMYFADKYGHSTRDNLQKIDYEHGSFMSTIAYRALMHMTNKVEVLDARHGCNNRYDHSGSNVFRGMMDYFDN